MSAELLSATMGEPYFKAYQRDYLADRSNRKALCKSRRIGGTEVAAAETAACAAGFDITTGSVAAPRGQIVVSASQNHSREYLSRCKHVLRGFERVTGPLISEGGDQVFRIDLLNGRSIVALPANPNALRGHEGDLTIDEVGAIPNAHEIYQAGQPITAPNLGNPAGYAIRVIGTPLGDGSLFYDIMHGERGAAFSKHVVSVHDAIAAGFPLTQADLDAFRAELDADMFAQEYECVFSSASARYISAELFDSCVVHALPPHLVPAGAGFDVARRGRHKSACVELWRGPDGVLYLRSLRVERGMHWPAQEAWASEAIGRSSAFAVDASGIGTQFGERLVEQHGSRVSALTFTTQLKEQLYSGLRLAFERRMLRVTPDPDLRRAVLAIRRRFTDHGNTIFDLSDDAHGHGDEAVALALAVHASGGALGTLGPGSDRVSWTPERSERSKFLRPRSRAWAQ